MIGTERETEMERWRDGNTPTLDLHDVRDASVAVASPN